MTWRPLRTPIKTQAREGERGNHSQPRPDPCPDFRDRSGAETCLRLFMTSCAWRAINRLLLAMKRRLPTRHRERLPRPPPPRPPCRPPPPPPKKEVGGRGTGGRGGA